MGCQCLIVQYMSGLTSFLWRLWHVGQNTLDLASPINITSEVSEFFLTYGKLLEKHISIPEFFLCFIPACAFPHLMALSG